MWNLARLRFCLGNVNQKVRIAVKLSKELCHNYFEIISFYDYLGRGCGGSVG
jgi:hypothetical protein